MLRSARSPAALASVVTIVGLLAACINAACTAGIAPAGGDGGTSDQSQTLPPEPVTPPCERYCSGAHREGCSTGVREQCSQDCAAAVKRALSCEPQVEAYLDCLARFATGCRDGAPFAAACENLGEASIACRTERHFQRSAANDDKCLLERLPSRAFVATAPGSAPRCMPLDGDDTHEPGELICCAYP